MACSSRTINTYDNEALSIGVYYNYQAATSGSGADLSAKNVPSPDTFCPLGWQMPYGGTDGDYYNQSKSWKYLLVQYGKDYSDNNVSTKNFMMSYPFSYIYTGNYIWGIYGVLMYFGIHGVYLSSSNYNSDRMDRFYLWGNRVNAESDTKTYGISIRFVLGISKFESFPWHPRSLISIMAFHFLKAHFPSVKIMSNYLKNETKYFIFMELRANFDEAESKYKMENRILMSE